MKPLIIYKTKHGSSMEYAQWLQEDTEGVLVNISDLHPDEIKDYNQVILVSRTYMGQIQLAPFLAKNWSLFQDKNVLLVAVGLVPADSEEGRKSYEAIPANIREKIKYFKVPGRIRQQDLGIFQKMLLKLMRRGPEDKVNRDELKPVLDYLKKQS